MSDRTKYEQTKQEFSLKNFRFNRFLLIRYALALFFFANIYWLLLAMSVNGWIGLLPGLLILVSILALAEHIKLFWQHKNVLTFTKFYFQLQLLVNIVLMSLVWLPAAREFIFPFLSVTDETVLYVFVWLLLGFIILLLVIRRLKNIEVNQDKAFQNIIKYEDSINRKSDKHVRK